MNGPAHFVGRPATYASQILWLYRLAMAMFVLTVGIGILNGLDMIEFEHDTLLTHVHAGTLGWITLSVFAFTFWLTGRKEGPFGRGLALWAGVSIPVFVVAFWVGNEVFKMVAGAAVMPAILGLSGYAIWAYRTGPHTAPSLAVAAATVSLAIGSTIGVLIQIERATGSSLLSEEAIGGHVGAQVVGYLVLTGMALAEWRLLPGAPLSRPAAVQIGLLFAGGLLGSIGAMTGSEALLGVFIPLEIAALVIFLLRMRGSLGRVPWLERGSGRHFGLIVPFLVANVGLLIVLIWGVVSGRYADFNLIPPWLVFAFDHAMFIGVMTNGLIGLGMLLATEPAKRWSWADDVAFWGINTGLIGFVVGLILESAVLKRLSTPVMGFSILIALLALAVRLQNKVVPEIQPGMEATARPGS